MPLFVVGCCFVVSLCWHVLLACCIVYSFVVFVVFGLMVWFVVVGVLVFRLCFVVCCWYFLKNE